MYASEMAKRGYAQSQKNVATETELELKIFTEITGAFLRQTQPFQADLRHWQKP